MTKNIKVLHIFSGYGGGISSFVRNIATAIDSDKFTFDVLSFTNYTDDFENEIARTGGKIFTMPRIRDVGIFKFFNETRQIIKNNGPYDYIECHISGIYAFVFKLITFNLNYGKFVIHAHATNDDNPDNLKSEFKRSINRRISVLVADKLTSCSTEASKFMFGNNVVKQKKVVHIPNSIPMEKYIRELKKEEIHLLKLSEEIDESKIVIGHVGRFNIQKNHTFMVDLIDYLSKKNINFVWVFVGTGILEDEIKNEIKSRKLEKYTKFMGRREDVEFLYQLFDVFVLPSFYEGLPTVLVETQAAGLNNVVSDTITKESDLNLNMISYLSLSDGLEKWTSEIVKMAKKEIPAGKVRKQAINSLGFSNESAAKIYEKFLLGKLEHYSIGDPLEF